MNAPKLQEQPNVLRCVNAVRAFCALQEAPGPEAMRWQMASLGALAEIYASCHSLPTIELERNLVELLHPLRVEQGEWRDLYDEIDHVLGSTSAYWGFADCAASEELRQEANLCDLTKDLADIYRHVKPGLRAWDSQEEVLREAAVLHWALSANSLELEHPPALHPSSWGRLVSSAMGALHDLCYGTKKDSKHPRF